MTITNAPVMYDVTAAKLQYSANGTQTDVPGTLPTGGITGQVCTKTIGGYGWATPGGGASSIGNVFDVTAYGADPTGASSSQTAFAAAIAAAKTSIKGPMYGPSNVPAAILYIPKGIYTGITSLNCTNMVGLTIQGEGSWGTAIYANAQTTAGPVFDFTKSSYITVKGVNVFGMNANGTSPTVHPLTAFLLAATTSDNDSNANKLEDCQATGWFTSGALCVVGSVCNQFYSCRFQNSDLSAPTLNLSTKNDWSITSPFQSITTGSQNVGKNEFFGCEFHGAKSSSAASWTLYFRNLDTANFFGCLIDNSASGSNMAHVIVQGTGNNKLSFFGSSFYTESGHSSASLLYVDGTLGSFLTHGCTETGAYSGTRLVGTAPGSVSNL